MTTLKQFCLILVVVFVMVLGVMAGKELSDEVAAAVVGIICGVSAGIPTSILILVVLTRQDRRRYEQVERQRQATAGPPVVIIQGGRPMALPGGQETSRPVFQVVGADGQGWEDY